MKRLFPRLIIVISWIASLSFSPIGLAEEHSGFHQSTFSATGVIKAKYRNGIILKRGDYFAASYSTKVIIEDKPFRLVSLPVPCKAQIDYVVNKKNKRRSATVIKVLEVPDGAKAGWRRAVPE